MSELTSKVIESLPVLVWEGERVFTTEQVAQVLGVNESSIRENLRFNRKRFTAGKHQTLISGAELKEFKRRFDFIYSISSKTRSLNLWKGCGLFRMAIIVDTAEAWSLIASIESAYFSNSSANSELQKLKDKQNE